MRTTCRFCPDTVDQDDPSVRWFDMTSRVFFLSHKECVFFCQCGAVIASRDVVRINPHHSVCGTCARNAVDLILEGIYEG